MVTKLGIEESKVAELCNILYREYGTTMAGLRVGGVHSSCIKVCPLLWFCHPFLMSPIFFLQAIGYKFDYDDYHRYCNIYIYIVIFL